jgi:signal transduction histidine kinase
MDPAQTARPLPTPRAVVEEVVVNGRTLSAAELSELGPGTKNVDFVFTGIDFRMPGRVAFRYMLEGFDRAWVEAGTRREASFTNLAPGRYRFRVQACLGAGNCTEAAGPELRIPPRIFERAWFPWVCGALVLACAWLVYLARIRRLKRHFSLILAERTRIARELHDTLLQGFSGVTMEMQALARRLPGDLRPVLEDIVADAAHALREVRLLLANLRNEPAPAAGLSAAIEAAVRQADGDGRVQLDLDVVEARRPARVEHNLIRIAQEAAANALKHSGAARVTVSLREHARKLSLKVADNGCGFVPDGAYAGHYGLLGMRERAAEIGARFEVRSQPGEGTTVTVELAAAEKEH